MRFGAKYVMESNHSGSKAKNSGDRMVLKPAELTMGTFQPNDETGTFRFYNNSDKEVRAELKIPDKKLNLTQVVPGNSITTIGYKC